MLAPAMDHLQPKAWAESGHRLSSAWHNLADLQPQATSFLWYPQQTSLINIRTSESLSRQTATPNQPKSAPGCPYLEIYHQAMQ